MTTQAANTPGIASRPLPPAITTDVSSFEAVARAAERIEVSLQSPGPEHRTQLMRFVLASIEAQLEQLGAAPRGYGPRDSIETSLSDQLYRSRLLGAGGIALRFASLEGIADHDGGLSWEDSHALRRMFAFAELEPLQIFLPEQSGSLRVLGEPQRLREWLPAASLAGRIAHIEYEPEPAESVTPGAPPTRSLDLAVPNDGAALAPPDVAAFIDAPGQSTAPGWEAPRTVLDAHAPTGAEPGAPSTHAGAAERELGADQPAHEASPALAEPPLAAGGAPSGSSEALDALQPAVGSPARQAPQGQQLPEAASPEALPPEALPPEALQPSAALQSPEALQREAEQRVEHQMRCASWLAQLRSMNGPKQHASVERAFVTAYLPLAREVATGHASAELRAEVDSWAEGFAHSYATAFKTLTGHARRPTMVRDIFDVALRWLQHYRARSCELLLVDCMRFDLGQRLNEEIERHLSGRAVCRDQALLWAALPSNSVAQRLAESSAAGQPRARGGRDSRADLEPPPGIQPLRVGSRELFRLDRLATELSKPGELEARRLERLARMLADHIVPWLRSLPPETLVVIFGDHGFHWQADERGTSAAQRGGALPEQVLVPASAWLLTTPRVKAGASPGLH